MTDHPTTGSQDGIPSPAPSSPPGLGPGPGMPSVADSVADSVGAGTNAGDRLLLGVKSRQSPVAVVFIAWRFLRNLGAVNLGLAAFFIFSGRVSSLMLFGGIGVVTVGLVFMVLTWWRFVFVVEGDELLVTKGVVAEERLAIPLDRIQSVSIDQKFLHRPIGLVSASVDTAGSAETEFTIDAVDRARAEALQRLAAGSRREVASPGVSEPVPHDRGSDAGAPEPGEQLLRRTPIELVRVGASRWPWAGLVALAPLLAFLNEAGDLLPFDVVPEGAVEETLDGVPQIGPALIISVIAVVLGVLILGAILGMLLQVVQALTTEWNLTLWRTSSGLRRTAGLFSTTSRASTLPRIQAVETDAPPVQRLLGIRRLTLPTIGEGDLVIPGATSSEVDTIRSILFGDDQPPPLDRMISPLYVFLAVRSAVVVSIPLLVLAALTVGWWAPIVGIIIPVSWWSARRRHRYRRWGMTGDRIAESYEFVSKHTGEMQLIKAQTVTLTQSFFERRRGLATVRLDTAEGFLAVPLLGLDDARAVRDCALHVVETNRGRWM